MKVEKDNQNISSTPNAVKPQLMPSPHSSRIESSMDCGHLRSSQASFGKSSKQKSTSLAIVIGLHVVVFGLAMQARHIISTPPKVVTTAIPLEDMKKQPEPEPEVLKPKLAVPPPAIFTLPPEVVTHTQPVDNTISIGTNVIPEDKSFKKDLGGVAEGEPPTSLPHVPVHVAAKVEANACDKPEYPMQAKRNMEEGTVHLAFLIGVDGKVLESKVEKSSGYRSLDRAAVEGLSLCRFKAGTVDGKPEPSWAKLQYAWTLE